VAEHGVLGDAYAPPPLHDMSEPVRELVHDPGAPYGRDAEGEPYSRAQWEARYVDADGRLVYPGNEGAVVGTRVEFTDMEKFKEHYGDAFDRMGQDRGDFLSPTGTPYEMRSPAG
jgi:hypothetical protein